ASPTNPITTSGTITVDTSASGLSGKYLRLTDTSSMLSPYVNSVGYGISKTSQTIKLDTATLSNKYVPYTGANSTVNIGDNGLISQNIRTTGD
ncbi:hypothetical protein ACI3PL_20435, partial [Lacticaseibacillus paracasei]